MRIAIGGSAKRTITAASHLLLFDNAYARIAENAGYRYGSLSKDFERELAPTAERDQCKSLHSHLSPYIRLAAVPEGSILARLFASVWRSSSTSV